LASCHGLILTTLLAFLWMPTIPSCQTQFQ
jgi:hypothetical protein